MTSSELNLRGDIVVGGHIVVGGGDIVVCPKLVNNLLRATFVKFCR